MAKHKNLNFDTEKTFSPMVMKTNLLLASLYLTGFELLKSAIVEGVKDFFIIQDEITPEKEQIMMENLDHSIVKRLKESSLLEIAEYERAVGIKVHERDKVGLMPSCKWLQEAGALGEQEVMDVKAMRDHRNEIAHELPVLLTSQGFNINLQHFEKMRRLLHKVDLFWARNDVLFSAETFEEVNISEIPDEEVISIRLALLNMITDTVVDYLKELSTNDQKPSG